LLTKKSEKDKFGKSTCAVVAFYARIADALSRTPASQHCRDHINDESKEQAHG
jgi:hypothetical protein